MTRINEILTVNLDEQIKSVIDLEDQSENQIQEEIQSYIITNGIGNHLSKFLKEFKSPIRETGVWISGFYGSGKSYFGKMIGHLLSNKVINGTPARDRFLQRTLGLEKQALLENEIRGLDQYVSEVVFFDVSKQDTSNGFSYTLFKNFLKTLGFRDDLYGYIEYELFITGKYDEFKSIVLSATGEDWDSIKKISRSTPKVMKIAHLKMEYSEADYSELLDIYKKAIQSFDSNKLKDEVKKYLELNPGKRVVFIIDEVSEGLKQGKITLGELEGISESLSGLNDRVWTIAIAQEQLGDVISLANLSSNEINKVTDRFRTKIHLESTEVDVIIKTRLLQKKTEYYEELINYYNTHEDSIADVTNLKGSIHTKTDSAEEFATYYPLHQYQFAILQDFLFSSKALKKNQTSERGMIITTFDVLRKEMKNELLYSLTPIYKICAEAQQAPPAELSIKYDTAKKVLQNHKSPIDGEKLFKTIHILSSSELVSTTVENITKCYISDVDAYYKTKDYIKQALDFCVESKLLLLTNNTYKITSDTETKLLEEMDDFVIQFFQKKKEITSRLIDTKIFNGISNISDQSESYNFLLESDLGDKLYDGSKYLRISVINIYNIADYEKYIETKKAETAEDNSCITLVPDISNYERIDKAIESVLKYKFIVDKYCSDRDSSRAPIISEFKIILNEKEKDLNYLLSSAYQNSVIIYRYSEIKVDSDSFKTTINEIQKKLIKNVYTKKVSHRLDDKRALDVLKIQKDKLSTLFEGEDFSFFDKSGLFIGNNLCIIEEIAGVLSSHYIDGKSLEDMFKEAPWGYSFGTIITTLAVLLRAQRLLVKINSFEYSSYLSDEVMDVFSSAKAARKASFKVILQKLTVSQKNEAHEFLTACPKEYVSSELSYELSEMQIAEIISKTSNAILKDIKAFSTSQELRSLFADIVDMLQFFEPFAQRIVEKNYIDIITRFIASGKKFSAYAVDVRKAKEFTEKKLPGVKEWKKFIEEVLDDLEKAESIPPQVSTAANEFKALFNENLSNNYSRLQNKAQFIRDEYYTLIKSATSQMVSLYSPLESKASHYIKELEHDFPVELNEINRSRLLKIKERCTKNASVSEPEIDYSSVKCKICKYSYSEIMSQIQLSSNVETQLDVIHAGFISEVPVPSVTTNDDGEGNSPELSKPYKVLLRIPRKIMNIMEYRELLTKQISILSNRLPDDEIEIDVILENR